jgi:hypothetical protein
MTPGPKSTRYGTSSTMIAVAGPERRSVTSVRHAHSHMRALPQADGGRDLASSNTIAERSKELHECRLNAKEPQCGASRARRHRPANLASVEECSRSAWPLATLAKTPSEDDGSFRVSDYRKRPGGGRRVLSAGGRRVLSAGFRRVLSAAVAGGSYSRSGILNDFATDASPSIPITRCAA